MKPKVAEISLNIIFWISTGWLITNGFSIQSQELELVNGIEKMTVVHNETMAMKLLIAIAISCLMFYINIWNLKRLVTAVKQQQVWLVSLSVFLGALLLQSLFDQVKLTGFTLPLPLALRIGVPAFYFTISLAYGLGKVWLHTQKHQQQLLLGKKQAELNLLRNQLQPHFLFNALNNLLSMIDQRQSPLLAESIERLSTLLRYVVDETKAQQVTIRQEIEFIRNYAALQLLRFEEKEVNFLLQVTGSFDHQLLEPGLLIPFVENAFKYGTEPEQASAINITIDLSKTDEVVFVIKNQLKTLKRQEPGTGTGIKATKERLELVYREKYQLTITENDYFIVTLKIMTL